MSENNTKHEATILVVDDNKNNLDLMLATLSTHNYRLLAATSGERAIKVANKVTPDLILMDIQMPEMDGFQTTVKLKEEPKFANTPILFLSALNDVKNIVRCFESGGVDYISKPFQKEELFARINTHLSIRRLQNQVTSERDKINSILRNILPEGHIRNLKKGVKPEPELVEGAAVLFTDFEDFTGKAKLLGPQNSLKSLNEIFFGFDEIMYRFDLERIKTIGDAYMAIGGVNSAHDAPLERIALAGLKLQEFIRAYNEVNPDQQWKLRVGVHYGPIITGIIGYQKIAFDVWGDTVNLASRLESQAKTDGITLSKKSYQRINGMLDKVESETVDLRNWGIMDICHCTGLGPDKSELTDLYNSIDVKEIINDGKDKEGLLQKIFDI